MVREIEHHEVVSCGILAGKFPDKHLCEWMNEAVISLKEAMEAYMVEVIAESHC